MCLNLISVWSTTSFIVDGSFFNFGPKFVSYILDTVSDGNQPVMTGPLDSVFPKMAKCTFYKYGYSGTPQGIDGLCVLSVNGINEKIYIFLWFWYHFLAAVAAWMVLFRLAVYSCPSLRR